MIPRAPKAWISPSAPYRVRSIAASDASGLTILSCVSAVAGSAITQLVGKLYEISAENFGRRVYEFYLDLGISKGFENEIRPEENRTKRFAKKMIRIPGKIIALPVNGSTRMIKASRKQIKKNPKVPRIRLPFEK